MKSIITKLVIVIVFLFAGAGAPAFAQNSSILAAEAQQNPQLAADLMRAPDTDVSLKVLQTLMGGDYKTATSTLPIVGDAMMVFNIIMLALGAGLFTVTAVSGVMRTGDEGDLLGKEWSSMWIPLRFGVSTVMLTPLVGGFSLGQIAAVSVIGLGVGTADSVWSAAAEGAVTRMGEASAYSIPANPKVRQAIQNVLRADTCVVMYQRSTDAKAEMMGITNPFQFGRTVDLSTASINWGVKSGPTREQLSDGPLTVLAPEGDYTTLCGTMKVPVLTGSAGNAGVTTSAASGVAAAAVGATAGGILAPIEFDQLARFAQQTADNLSQVGTAARKAQFLGFVDAANTLDPIAEKLAPTYRVYDSPDGQGGSSKQYVVEPHSMPTQAQINDAIDKAATFYQEQVGMAVDSELKNSANGQSLTNSILADARSSGWATAGVWFFQLAKIQSEVGKYISWTPDMMASSDVVPSDANAPDSVEISNGVSAINNASDMKIDLGHVGSPDGIFTWVGRKALGLLGLNFETLKTGGALGVGEFIGFDPTDYRHPLVQIQQSGTKMLAIGTAILVADSTMKGLNEGASGSLVGKVAGMFGSDFIKSIVTDALKLLSYLGIVILACGFTKAYVIPMLPFFKMIKVKLTA